MNLYLVQHAEPKPKEVDAERSLSEKGMTDIRKVASFLAGTKNVRLSGIMHSGKTRARQSAEVLSEYLNPSEGVKEVDGLSPLDDPSIWADRLSETEEDVMLVGHLPHLSKLSANLICQDEDKKVVGFQMGGIVCLGRDESGGWSVLWMVIPEMLP